MKILAGDNKVFINKGGLVGLFVRLTKDHLVNVKRYQESLTDESGFLKGSDPNIALKKSHEAENIIDILQTMGKVYVELETYWRLEGFLK